MFKPMTNEQAAAILYSMLAGQSHRIGRGNGKSATNAIIMEAFMKAIVLLQNTPDE